MWCIQPDQDGAFVARMERLLEIYSQFYDPHVPIVCMDEQPYRLLSETRPSRPVTEEQSAKEDYEYTREGYRTIWMFVELLGQWRDVEMSDRRTACDWAERIRRLKDNLRFPFCTTDRSRLRQPQYA